MKLNNRLEQKMGKFAIHNLMYYIIIIQAVGVLISNMAPTFTEKYLLLDFSKVFQGQVWRLFTFIAVDLNASNLRDPFDIIFLAISFYLYYFIGRTLENVWGAFRFNVYYLSGILLTILGCLGIYLIYNDNFLVHFPYYYYGIHYINLTLFLTFACVFPEMEMLFMFVIPMKLKWLGVISGAFLVKDLIECIMNARAGTGFFFVFLGQAVAIVVALLNFVIFFLSSRRNYRQVTSRQAKRKQQYMKQVRTNETGTRHRCAVCGRTEQDDPMLEFRYCSKCDGNYEYCMEHLFTHEHVKKH